MTSKYNSKEKKFKIATILIFATFILIFIFDRYKERELIKSLKSETIGITTRFQEKRENGRGIAFYFYHNGKKVVGRIRRNNLNSSVLNKFYKVKFNENNPGENFLFIDNEIKTDSLTLIESGFKYVKFHKLNISTNTYEENWKWE